MVNKEFFLALEQLEKEKGISVDYMLDRVGQALITAYKRENDGMTDNVYVIPDREDYTIRMFVRKTVVDEFTSPTRSSPSRRRVSTSPPPSSAILSTSTSRPSLLAVSLPRLQSRLLFRASARLSAAAP